MTVDALASPPEVNSARLISGAGIAPMQVAATAYTSLGVYFESAAGRLSALLAQQATFFQGDSAAILQGRFAPYIAWLHTTSAQLLVAAGRAEAQVGSYVAAVAAMPTLPELAAIQTEHATLIATNPLVAGANTPLIVANEAAYAAEWTRAAAVQSAYFAQSAANSTFEAFAPSPTLAVPANGVAEASIAATLAAASGTPMKDLHVAVTEAHAQAQNVQMVVNAGMSQSYDTGAKEASHDKLAGEESATEGKRQAHRLPPPLVSQQQAAQAAQIAGQGAQQAVQVPTQVASQASSLLSRAHEGLGLSAPASPGFAGTNAESPTLSALNGSGGGSSVSMGMLTGSFGGVGGGSLSRVPDSWAALAMARGGGLPPPIPPGGGAPPSTPSAAGANAPMAPTGSAGEDRRRSQSRGLSQAPLAPVFVDTDALREELRDDDQYAYAATISSPADSEGDDAG